MKKIITWMLITLMTAGLCACSSDGGNDKEGNGSSNKETSKQSEDASTDGEGSGKSGSNYKTYEDLPEEIRIYYNPNLHGEEDGEDYEVVINEPDWGSKATGGNSPLTRASVRGDALSTNFDEFRMVIFYNSGEAYSGDIEEFGDTAVWEFLSIIGNAVSDYYTLENMPGNIQDILDSKEVVELDCGEKALKYSGTVPEMVYENYTKDPVYFYGYSFVYNEDVNITVGFEIHDPEKVSEYEDMLKGMVDRAVKTIRLEEPKTWN